MPEAGHDQAEQRELLPPTRIAGLLGGPALLGPLDDARRAGLGPRCAVAGAVVGIDGDEHDHQQHEGAGDQERAHSEPALGRRPLRCGHRCRASWSRRYRFTSRPPPKPGERAVRADDAVARQHDRHRVGPVGRADGPGPGAVAVALGQLAVGRRRAVGDRREAPPGPSLELGADEVEGHLEAAQSSVEVRRELGGRPLQHREGRIVLAPPPVPARSPTAPRAARPTTRRASAGRWAWPPTRRSRSSARLASRCSREASPSVDVSVDHRWSVA